MPDLDITTLAESLRDVTLNLQMFIDVQAEAVAEPRIRAALDGARAARLEQRADAAAFDRRLADCQREMRRQLEARDKQIERFKADAAVAKKAVCAIEALHAWINEDGKQFVFCDDLWAALAAVSYVAKAATDSKKEN